MAAEHHSSSDGFAALKYALFLTAAFFLVEAAAGFLTHSLALLSDAGHMLSDILALLISLYAAIMSRKAPTAQKSYGYYRTEVLAALFNGLILFLMFGFIYWEAFHRLFQPVSVHGKGVIVIGGAGLLVNLIAAWLLRHPHNMNTRSAYYHVILDALGSVAALLAGILITVTGWYIFDPILSMVIGALVLYSSWTLMREAIDILMESVPKHLDPEVIRRQLKDCEGVESIHDLHIWSIDSRSHALSAHVKVPSRFDPQQVRVQIENLLRTRFHLEHTTLQLECQEECVELHE